MAMSWLVDRAQLQLNSVTARLGQCCSFASHFENCLASLLLIKGQLVRGRANNDDTIKETMQHGIISLVS